eukprot:TRINITY_DN23409_c0_g1_i1.p1 TRINITY_DN23409_c0_g1~~TRINITY_DN23409_c0_g1_i1.p1  ORF type:complete len:1054 (+),score=347.18 TRINITY_DN23409_c0_g1_i1:305-3466(+)
MAVYFDQPHGLGYGQGYGGYDCEDYDNYPPPPCHPDEAYYGQYCQEQWQPPDRQAPPTAIPAASSARIEIIDPKTKGKVNIGNTLIGQTNASDVRAGWGQRPAAQLAPLTRSCEAGDEDEAELYFSTPPSGATAARQAPAPPVAALPASKSTLSFKAAAFTPASLKPPPPAAAAAVVAALSAAAAAPSGCESAAEAAGAPGAGSAEGPAESPPAAPADEATSKSEGEPAAPDATSRSPEGSEERRVYPRSELLQMRGPGAAQRPAESDPAPEYWVAGAQMPATAGAAIASPLRSPIDCAAGCLPSTVSSCAPRAPPQDAPGGSFCSSASRSLFGDPGSNPGRRLSESIDGVVRKMNGILNRMTPEKFSRLLGDMFKLIKIEVRFSGETMRDLLGRIAPIIFEKAVAEPAFSAMYAELCSELHAQVDSMGLESGESGEGIIKTSKQRLQAILLNMCQKEFEANLEVQRQIAQSRGCDNDEAHLRAKQRKLGNIKFIAELFKRQLMPEQIVHLVVQRLLNMSSQSGDPPSEPDVEILCKLFEAAGERMDRPAAQEYNGKYFTRMRKLTQLHPCPRCRFLLLNIVELRDAGWRGKKVDPDDKLARFGERTGCRSRADSSASLRRGDSSASLHSLNSSFDGSPKPVVPGRPPRGGAPGVDDVVLRTVYITGIDTGLHPGELDAFLGLHGRVVKKRLCGDSSHVTQFGFFEFDSQEAAQSLLARDKTVLGRHPIHCSVARAAILDRRGEDRASTLSDPCHRQPVLSPNTGSSRPSSTTSIASLRFPTAAPQLGGGSPTAPPARRATPPDSGPRAPSGPEHTPKGEDFLPRTTPATLFSFLSARQQQQHQQPQQADHAPAARGEALEPADAVGALSPSSAQSGLSRGSETPPLSEQQLDLKSRAMIDELVQNESLDAYSKDLHEVPTAQRPAVVARQFSYVVSQTRLCDERKALCDVIGYAQTEAEKQQIRDGLALAVDEFIDTEFWIDCPKLWNNLAFVLLESVNRHEICDSTVRNALAQLSGHPEWPNFLAACEAEVARGDRPLGIAEIIREEGSCA